MRPKNSERPDGHFIDNNKERPPDTRSSPIQYAATWLTEEDRGETYFFLVPSTQKGWSLYISYERYLKPLRHYYAMVLHTKTVPCLLDTCSHC